ncbi:unnamed protein product [Schistosoma margrebowiei]|uniref:Uncharacterized protein n=1 Tax=Schistosoma margrebowiei TaxID=48269 RepID=A0A183MV16_9TREM|nr:unnamed protein product [Schistosoma margrebowiei]
MVEPTGTCVPANIARLGHHDRQAQRPRQGSSYGRDMEVYVDLIHPFSLIRFSN